MVYPHAHDEGRGDPAVTWLLQVPGGGVSERAGQRPGPQRAGLWLLSPSGPPAPEPPCGTGARPRGTPQRHHLDAEGGKGGFRLPQHNTK